MKKQSADKSLGQIPDLQVAGGRDKEIGHGTRPKLKLLVSLVPPESATIEPWLDSAGQPLTIGRLKQRSKTWPFEIWQRYCEYLESEESQSSESRISPKALEEELEGMIYEIDECLEGPIDFSKLHVAIKALNSVQQTIIQKVFWSGQTVREIAHEMKLSRSTVQRLKSQAQSALYAKMWDTSPFIRGEVVFLTQKEGRKRAA